MEVGIEVVVRHFLIFKRGAYMRFLKFPQVFTEICIILEDLTWYKDYILHHKMDFWLKLINTESMSIRHLRVIMIIY